MPFICTTRPDAAPSDEVEANQIATRPQTATGSHVISRALEATNVSVSVALGARLVQLYGAFLAHVLSLLCSATCVRTDSCRPAAAHDVIVLNTHGGSGTTRTQALFELYTGRATQSWQRELERLMFLGGGRAMDRQWGSPGDGSYYVTINASVRKPLLSETALVKSHSEHWACSAKLPPANCYVDRVVHVMRNPVDNIISNFRREVVKRSPPWQRVMGGGELTPQAAKFWRTTASRSMQGYVEWHVASLKAYRTRRVLLVHYEDISETPASEVERILAFAGVAPLEEKLASVRQYAAQTARGRPHHDFVRGLPWEMAKEPRLLDQGTVAALADVFESTMLKLGIASSRARTGVGVR